jgi:tellurite resistance protein
VVLLGDALAQTVVKALYAVCRADGDVNELEVRALRAAARELGAGEVDEQALFFSEVTPHALVEALRGSSGGPFRGAGTNAPVALRRAFLAAAERIARIDGDYNDAEQRLIDQFRSALETLDGERREG